MATQESLYLAPWMFVLGGSLKTLGMPALCSPELSI